MKHIAVIDLSVAYHQLHDTLTLLQLDHKHWLPVVKAQLTWMMSARWLNSRFGPVDQVILACDVKPYWRSQYLTRPGVLAGLTGRGTKATQKKTAELAELLKQQVPDDGDWGTGLAKEAAIYKLADELAIHYKAGRKFPAQTFVKLRDQIRKLCAEQGWPMLQKTGYEADDWAAAIVTLNERLPEPNNITLVTVDSDWMGLVSPNVDWFCMKGYKPRTRSYGSTQFDEWVNRRLGVRLDEPSDIWKVKQVQGDKSDNLPKGGPLEVIDLLEPPEEFRLWEQDQPAVLVNSWLTGPPGYTIPDVDKAVDYLQRSGVPLFIRSDND